MLAGARIELFLPACRNLKEKRAIVKSILGKLRSASTSPRRRWPVRSSGSVPYWVSLPLLMNGRFCRNKSRRLSVWWKTIPAWS